MPHTLVFILGCLFIRCAVAVAICFIPKAWLFVPALAATLLICSWLRIMLWSPRDTGPEVKEGRIWWQKFRVLHVINYTIFATMAFSQNTYAYIPLLVDAGLGAGLFLQHHYPLFT